jgi:hypothetical protein
MVIRRPAPAGRRNHASNNSTDVVRRGLVVVQDNGRIDGHETDHAITLTPQDWPNSAPRGRHEI